MIVRYETVVDDIGNWDCFLVLINDDGLIERVENDVSSEQEHWSYKPISRGRIGQEFCSLVDEYREMNRKEMNCSLPVFYLFSYTPCTGERSWFIPVCQQNGINYELLSACWEINND